MKKLAAIIAAVGLSLCSLTGCAQSGVKNSAQATAENPMILTLAHGLSETHTVHIAMTEFAEKVKERTDGRIQLQIFPNGQLGSENENMEQLMSGVISMTKVSAPGLATYNESYHAFGLPYIFDSTEDFYHVMDSSQMHDFFLSSGNDGFVTLTYYTSGARSFYTKNKAIRKPEDLKGLKIRTMTNNLHVEYFTALGAIPTPMSFSELFTALQQKTVDGQENPTALIYNNALYEAQKYMSVSEHVFTAVALNIASDFYNSLPEDYQAAIKEAAENTMEYQRELITEENESLLSEIEAAGVEVTVLTDEQKAAFQKVAEDTVYKTAAETYGQELIDMAANHNK